jgi:hypothetical protein
LSRGAAHYRKVAARLVRARPAVLEALRDGRLCITSVVELARVLTPANEAEVLPRFFHRSRREAREVAAALSPASAVPTRATVTRLQSVTPGPPRVQQVEPGGATVSAAAALRVQLVELDLASVTATPAPSVQPVEPGPAATVVAAADAADAGRPVPPTLPPAGLDQPPSSVPAQRPSAALDPHPCGARGQDASSAVEPLSFPPLNRPPTADEIKPLTADRFRLHVTVSRRFLAKLEAARAARSHARPGASAEDILEEALDLLLTRETRRREAKTSRRPPPARPSSPGRIPAAARREVWARDGGCCQWPLASGGICGSTRRLELDHVVPRALGGSSIPENLRILCQPHNLEAARQLLGDWAVGGRLHPKANPSGGPAEGTRRGVAPVGKLAS